MCVCVCQYVCIQSVLQLLKQSNGLSDFPCFDYIISFQIIVE